MQVLLRFVFYDPLREGRQFWPLFSLPCAANVNIGDLQARVLDEMNSQHPPKNKVDPEESGADPTSPVPGNKFRVIHMRLREKV